MRCIIIEDQLPAQRILQRYIGEVEELELVETFTNPLKALHFLQHEQVDLIFLDIHLPKMTGMDLLKILPNRPKVIVTTAFSDYAIEGFELDVVDYLLKPISFDRFIKSVSKVLYTPSHLPTEQQPVHLPQTIPQQSIFVKSDRSIIRLDIAQIIYIKSEDDFSKVFLQDKRHLLSQTLKAWEEILPSEQFCRIHKSCIVNLQFVEKIEGNEVFTSKYRLPIGRSYRDSFLEQIDLR